MSNPARDLHSLLQHWSDSIGSGRNRFLVSAVDIRNNDGAAEIIRAFGLISRVSSTINEAEATQGVSLDVFKNDLKTWIQIVVGFSADGWLRETTGETAVPQSALDNLMRLALYLDGKIVIVTPGRADLLNEVLGEVESLLSDGDLSTELSQYIRILVMDISRALSDENHGFGFDYGEAVRRLWVCLGAAENESSTVEKKAKFATLREKIAPGVATSVLSSAIVSAGSLVFQAITQ